MAVRFADLADRSQRTSSVGMVGFAAAAAAAAALATAFALTPHQVENGPVVCPFRLLTGLPCPGCGLTRSWVYLAHGDFGAAVRANPFGLVTMAAATALLGAVASAAVRGRPLQSPSSYARPAPVLAVAAAWLAFAVLRVAAVIVR
jgi:hypothetical protein